MEGSALRSDRASRASAGSGSLKGGTFRSSGPGVGDYLRIIYRHRWLALAALVLIAVPIGLYGVLQPKAFEARIRIVVDAEPSAPVPFKDATGGTGTADERTQQEIVRSRDVALRTILALRLWERSEFGGSGAAGPARTDGPIAPTRDDQARAELLVSGFITRIKVIAIPLSRLMDVVVEASDAQLAADIANELGRQFIQQDLDTRAASSQQANSWLDDRLAEQRKRVEESESALQQYKEQQDALSVEGRQNIVVQKLSDLNAAVTRAKTERLSRQTANEQVQRAQTDPSLLDSIPAIASNVVIRQLQTSLGDLQRQQTELGQRYGEKHPEMIKIASAIESTQQRLTAEIAKAADVVKNEYLGALAQEQSLLRALNEQKDEALRLNKQDLEYGRLQREAETQRQIYNALAQQSRQTGIAAEFKETPIRILDKAQRPIRPVRPQRTKFVALAAALGLFGALGIALGREFLDTRFKTPQEIHDHLHLPFLGLVPAIKMGRKSQNGPGFSVAASPFSDALRRIRSTLILGAPQTGSTTLLVTSTAPQEGKSTMVVGLAQCFAAASQRVLIIDTDLRRPRVDELLDEQPEHGLTQYLEGHATIDQVIVPTKTRNLSVITAGGTPDNPSELLGQPLFNDLLEAVRSRFDWIFIDSAPVLSVSDAPQLARTANGILFVVAAQMATRNEVQRAVQHLMQAGVPFAGCVLNRADIERHAFYYAPYHNQQYEKYYRQRK